MAMIFPGMDPYLEDAQRWPGVHHRLITYAADALQPRLRPRYTAAIETRVYIEEPDREIAPDVLVQEQHTRNGGVAVALAEADTALLVQVAPLEVHEAYIAIRDRDTDRRVVTVIELLSPTNKYAGPGRTSYETKQREVLSSNAHLVEIDLLRFGPHVLAVPEWAARNRGPYYYLVCVNRGVGLRDTYELYPRRLPERLPRIRVPLADNDPDVVLDIQAVLDQVYEAGNYRDDLNYNAPCIPALSTEDQAWANERIQEARQP
ncbi:MAG: DUF4058 family protein [Planctomycetia bacterium]|nr:DUF4058 family protein [Planctomycetia bacterium]